MSDARRAAVAAELCLVLLAGLAGPVLALAPLGMAPLFMATGLLAPLADRIQTGHWPHPPRTLVLLLAMALAWSAVSLAWTTDPVGGVRKLLDIGAIWLALLGALGTASALGEAGRTRVAMAAVIGLGVGLILLVIETMFDYPLHRLILGNDPRLVDLVESKRSVDSLPLLVWVVALGLKRLGRPWLGLVLVVVFAAASLRWTASSATMAMAVSLLVFAAAALRPRLIGRLLAAATVLVVVAVVPFSIAAYDHGAADAHAMKVSARHRMEIWHFAAERVLECPLFGHGFNASRSIPNGHAVSRFQAPDKPIIPLHPHNGFLQIWLELGIVGAVIGSAIMLFAIRSAAGSGAAAAPYLLAEIAAGMLVGGLAFGLWQSWWMATLAMGAALMRVVATRQQ